MNSPAIASSLEALADLRLSQGGVQLLDESGYRLLLGLRSAGCILDASRLSGISYRTARSHLQSLGSAWGSPVAEGRSGGTRGGATRLTEAGERLLDLYVDLRRDHEQCLQTLNRRLSQEWNRPLRSGAPLPTGAP